MCRSPFKIQKEDHLTYNSKDCPSLVTNKACMPPVYKYTEKDRLHVHDNKEKHFGRGFCGLPRSCFLQRGTSEITWPIHIFSLFGPVLSCFTHRMSFGKGCAVTLNQFCRSKVEVIAESCKKKILKIIYSFPVVQSGSKFNRFCQKVCSDLVWNFKVISDF